MKKLLLVALFMGTTGSLFAQTYMTRTGKVSFNATSPKSPEKVEAVNNEAGSILNSKTGDFVFQLPVKGFKFESDLMQQHFNENYMESDKFPKSDFKGKISNMADVNYAKDGSYNVTVAGKLTIHGITKDVSVPGTITIKGKEAVAKAKFTVKLADYGIAIPGVVADKLNKEATIMIDAALATK
jgi:hypothetical protein